MTNVPQKDGVGVVIGRFQTPHLHKGHCSVLSRAGEQNHLLVFVGVHGTPGAYGQELDFSTRKLMIQKKFPKAIVLPLRDCPVDEMWSKQLDRKISEIFPFSPVSFYYGRDSFLPHYMGRYKTFIEVEEEKSYNATALREECYRKISHMPDFRHGVFYGLANRFPTVSPTVDIAITRDDYTKVLLGKKNDGRGWRFPGGFIDIADESAEAAAAREAVEETNLYLLPENAEYICSRKVKDWRNTARNSVMTYFYHFEYLHGHAKAGDDLSEIKWFEIEQLKNVHIVDEHDILRSCFLRFLKKGQ